MKKCVIIGSVPIKNHQIFNEYNVKDSFLICADGGMDTAREAGLNPNLLIGDFDSVKGELPKEVETIRLQVEKDDTDSMAAAREGVRRGYREFVLLGMLGGDRFDHSIANLSLLQFLCRQECKAMIAGDSCQVFLIREGKLTLKSMKGTTVSVFPFGCSACRVSYTGLKYPLTQATLRSDIALGVSNVVVEDSAQIFVHSGDALILVLP